MGSSSDSHRDARRTQRRDSSPRGSSQRRPRLLRATATEPMITTLTAIRNSFMTDSQFPRRATDLLSQVAVVSGPSSEPMVRPASPISARTAMCVGMEQRQQEELSSSPASWSEPSAYSPPLYSGRYVSFPSFDLYEAPLQQGEKEAPMKVS